MTENRRTMTYEELLKRDGAFLYKNSGVSMLPLIREGRDLIYIRARSFDEEGRVIPLKKYDVALFRRNGRYILHRVIDVENGAYTMCGDNCYTAEKNIPEKDVIGVLDKVIRKEKVIDPCEPAYLKKLETDPVRRARKIRIRNFSVRVRRKLGLWP